MQLVGANPQPHVTGEDELPGKNNYFFGNDPAQWHTNVPTYAKVKYENVYPGVDLVYYGNQQQLEYDFVVAPGADPTVIRLAFGSVGAVREPPLHIDTTGDLVLHTADSEIWFHQPRIYQEIDGTKQPITGRYVLLDAKTPNSEPRTQEVGFVVTAYDTNKPLVIDPGVVYSTYLGGSGADQSTAIAVDTQGNVYVTGRAGSDFPTTSGAFRTTIDFQVTRFGAAFVTKLNAAGDALVSSTYLGDASISRIAVDFQGNAYVTGLAADGFPTTIGAFRTDFAGESFFDGFVTKVSPTGDALAYSTYLGGSTGSAIAVDATSNAYVTGETESSTVNFLLLGHGGFSDSFIMKLNPVGSGLVYATRMGGGQRDYSSSIAVDAWGNAYVTGATFSSDFPTVNAVQPTYRGGFFADGSSFFDAFVAKLNSTGNALVYSTYLGGTDNDLGEAIAVDDAGNAYVTGTTGSTDFPTVDSLPFAPVGSGGGVFVVKLNATDSALIYSKRLGDGQSAGLTVDAGGNAYVTGTTQSTDFPTVNPLPLQEHFHGGFNDAFVAEVNPQGNTVFSTYLGGSDQDFGHGIAADPAGSVYVTGETQSSDFPTQNAFQPSNAGGRCFGTAGFGSCPDVFIVKISDGIRAFFESPENGPVSGITVIRGWAFATDSGSQIDSVELFIDDTRVNDIPCCSERVDVQAAFPQFSAENTLNSGWGVIFNWGLLSAGVHTVRGKLRDTVGNLFFTDTRTVTVVKAGDSEYLDWFALSGATAMIGRDELAVEGIVVRDKASRQQKRLNASFRWQSSTQSFGMVEAQTIEVLALSRSLFSSLLALLSPRLLDWQAVANAQASPIIQASFESPEEGQVVSGIGVIRGWTFDEARATLPPLRLFIDGQVGPLVPCCSTRADIAAVFPTTPHALNSGWGTIFNYNLLSAGNHTIQVGLGYFGLSIFLPQHNVTVVKLGGFEFLDQFNLSGATTRIEGENIVLSGVTIRDKASRQTKTVDVWLRWFESAQGLGIVAAGN